LGTIFLTSGIVKFVFGIGNFAAGLQTQFAGKLPVFMVIPFAYALPLLEVTVGAFLLFGLFNSLALIAAGLLLMILIFGKRGVNDSATVAGNLVYVLINFVLQWLADYNGSSIDRKHQRKAPINLS
jgi:thiosulfate dehydrogenase [quinone] large subunit